jgi:hypothetical protein
LQVGCLLFRGHLVVSVPLADGCRVKTAHARLRHVRLTNKPRVTKLREGRELWVLLRKGGEALLTLVVLRLLSIERPVARVGHL